MRGGFIEIAAQDPAQGTVFYTAQANWFNRLAIARSDSCLSCHFTGRTGSVPGMIEPMGQTRPLEMRWGGWYVTGRLHPIRHFGNVDPATLVPAPDRVSGDIATVETSFDASGYLTPHSDVAALLVFEHQMQMMNLLTRVGWQARAARHEGRPDMAAVLQERVDEAVDYMLFVGEAAIQSPVTGSSEFARVFERRGPRDGRGRSLYQLDLTTRLLRYPCSYLIYSDQFDQLPADAKLAIYRRLWAVLSGTEKDEKYRHLAPVDRRAIVEILRATKRDLPPFFTSPR